MGLRTQQGEVGCALRPMLLGPCSAEVTDGSRYKPRQDVKPGLSPKWGEEVDEVGSLEVWTVGWQSENGFPHEWLDSVGLTSSDNCS